MSCKDRDAMQPGDLVRIGYGRAAGVNAGKIGVIVQLRQPPKMTYDVLIDGCIGHFYGFDLVLINEAG
jgi:hypothetical protein